MAPAKQAPPEEHPVCTHLSWRPCQSSGRRWSQRPGAARRAADAWSGTQRPTPGHPGGTCPGAEACGPGGGEAAQVALPDPRTPLRSAPRGSGCPRACAQRGHTWRLFSAPPGLAFPGAAQGRPSPLTRPTCGPRAQVESLTRLRGSAGTAASPEGSLRPRALSDGGRGPEEAGASTPRTPPASSRVTSFLQIPSGWCAAPARGWGGTRAVREPEPVTREARTCWRGRLVGSHLEILVTREGG